MPKRTNHPHTARGPRRIIGESQHHVRFVRQPHQAQARGRFNTGANASFRRELHQSTYRGSHIRASAAQASARAWLADEFADTYGSVIRPALSDDYTVYSKPGWIDGDGGLYSLSDAGVVHTGSGDYVLAVMTDAAGEYDLLYNLVAVLDQIHSDVMGS